VRDEDLVARFVGSIPHRVAEGTELWLALEGGAREKLPELRRLLHTLKGEAHMLGLAHYAALSGACESAIDEISRTGAGAEVAGDVLLGALELLGLLEEGRDLPIEACLAKLADVTAELRGQERAARVPSERPEPAPAPEPRDQRSITVAELGPVVAEVRRLQREQTVLQPRLREIQRMLRQLLREVDPKLDPASLAERIVKTLTFGAETDRRLGAIASEWASVEFSMSLAIDQLEDLVRSASVVSLARLEAQIQRVARSAAQAVGKRVEVRVEGSGFLDAAIEKRLGPALQHLVRNAVDHGIETPGERTAAGKPEQGRITVSIVRTDTSVRVVVADDGRGVDFAALRAKLAAQRPAAASFGEEELLAALFEHGVTTRDQVSVLSGRGVGLDVVASEIAAIGGKVSAETVPGTGTRFVMVMPAALGVDVVLPVRASTLRCAIPSRVIASATRVAEIEATSQGPMIHAEIEGARRLVPVRSLAAVLGMRGDVRVGQSALVIDHPLGRYAVTVEAYEDPRAVTATAAHDQAFRSPLVRAVAPLPDGGLLLVLDAHALRDAVVGSDASAMAEEHAPKRAHHVMVVEDAPIARELVCGILRSFGLRVTECLDGSEGLAKARADKPDVVLTDIEMPVMDGLAMIGEMRRDPALAAVPILVLTTRHDPATEASARALGVRGFMAKHRFVESELRAMIDACLGA
jgi:two-component system chemotaxis sensor kinase CheA